MAVCDIWKMLKDHSYLTSKNWLIKVYNRMSTVKIIQKLKRNKKYQITFTFYNSNIIKK